MKHFILKVDDFRLSEGLAKFDRLLALCATHAVPMSMGVIGGGLRGGRFLVQERLARGCDTGAVELWNHSFNHRDLTLVDDSEVAWEIAATTSVTRRMLGRTPVGFGAPFNKCDARISAIAREQGMGFTYETALDPAQVLTPEYNIPFDGQPNLPEFIRRVERKSHFDTLIVQVHPGRWLSRGFEQMHECLSWLRGAGYAPTTMTVLFGPADERRAAVRGVHELMVQGLVDHWAARAPSYDISLSNFSSYFLTRFRHNSSEIRRVLQAIDADLAALNVVDVGCGLAQWSLPFFEFDKNARLWAFDTNATIAKALEDAHTAKLIPHDLRVCCEDFTTSSRLPDAGVDRIVCANALNYIPIEAFAQQARRVLKDGGRLILLNQTDAFNRVGVKDALHSNNVAAAKERAMAALRQRVVRLGFRGFIPSRTTLTAAELETVLYAFGFQLTDDFIPGWERHFQGEPTFEGLVFTRRSWVEPAQIKPEFRSKYRKLLCRSGFAQLDDQLFPDDTMDLTDTSLALLRARGGYLNAEIVTASLANDIELGRLVNERNFFGASDLVWSSNTRDPEWLLAGTVAALLAADGSRARELMTRTAPRAGDAEVTKNLVDVMCRLLDGDLAGAQAIFPNE